MAQQRSLLILLAVLSAIHTSVVGVMECEDLPVELCAFAVSSSGSRCVLESNVMRDGNVQYECQTSVVMADKFVEWIETEDCINACGLDRMSVGISTDSLVETEFTQMLCSAECQNNCPNVFELYTKLAAGEGVYLPQLCEAQGSDSRRIMGEVSFASKSTNTINPWEASAPSSQHSFGSQNYYLAPAPAVQP